MKHFLYGAIAGLALLFGLATVVQSQTITQSNQVSQSVASWTPVLTFATPGDLSVAYTTQSGTYSRQGRRIVIHCQIVTSSFTHFTASGVLRVTGLPFNASAAITTAFAPVAFGGITKANYTTITSQIVASGGNISFIASGSGQAVSTVTAADLPTGGTVVLDFTTTYLAD